MLLQLHAACSHASTAQALVTIFMFDLRPATALIQRPRQHCQPLNNSAFRTNILVWREPGLNFGCAHRLRRSWPCQLSCRPAWRAKSSQIAPLATSRGRWGWNGAQANQFACKRWAPTRHPAKRLLERLRHSPLAHMLSWAAEFAGTVDSDILCVFGASCPMLA